MSDGLRNGFDYDLWANRLWAPVAMAGASADAWARIAEPPSIAPLPTEPRARAVSVFVHILRVHRIWLSRCGAEVTAVGEGWLPALYEAWGDQIDRRAPSELIAYPNPDPVGGSLVRTFGDVAWQTVNHGTYHRGQLREILGAIGVAVPETDVAIWRPALGLPVPA